VAVPRPGRRRSKSALESTITIFSNWGAASALGVVLLVLALALVGILHRVFGLDRLFVR
jgi:ABC-type spermidine/putrescine transport system permease subunit I